MATFNGSINGGSEKYPLYDLLFIDLADSRTNSWFLIQNPGPVLALIGLWLYFVLKLGPEWMKDKKPYELRTVLIVYNFLQVLISAYIFIRAGQVGWFSKYNWTCEPVDFSNSDNALEVASLCHLYFLAKLTELLDTVFFILRKKDRQVTFLHVYHHAIMPMVSWGCTKYFPGGHGTFIGFLNSFIHIIMYTYYTLAAVGPSVHKYLWWKKYITTLQLIQFCCIFIHNSQLFFNDCGYPRWTAYLTVPNSVFFYQLFRQFYKQAYTVSRKTAYKKKTDDNSFKNLNNGNDSSHKLANGINKVVINGKIK